MNRREIKLNKYVLSNGEEKTKTLSTRNKIIFQQENDTNEKKEQNKIKNKTYKNVFSTQMDSFFLLILSLINREKNVYKRKLYTKSSKIK